MLLKQGGQLSNMEKVPNAFELKKKEIDTKIDYLLENHATRKEFFLILESIKELSNSYGEPIDENVREELDKVLNKFEKTTIKLDSLPEFSYALEKISNLPKKLVQEVVAHENAHINKAEELGAKDVGYVIGVFKHENGKIAIFPLAWHIFNKEKGYSKEEIRQISIQISEAPKIYGEKLSPRDIAKINNLRDKSS